MREWVDGGGAEFVQRIGLLRVVGMGGKEGVREVSLVALLLEHSHLLGISAWGILRGPASFGRIGLKSRSEAKDELE